jgi:hypothetical protein
VPPTPSSHLALELFGEQLSISSQGLQDTLSSLNAEQRLLFGHQFYLLLSQRVIFPIPVQPCVKLPELVDFSFVVTQLRRQRRQLAGQGLYSFPRLLQLIPRLTGLGKVLFISLAEDVEQLASHLTSQHAADLCFERRLQIPLERRRWELVQERLPLRQPQQPTQPLVLRLGLSASFLGDSKRSSLCSSSSAALPSSFPVGVVSSARGL